MFVWKFMIDTTCFLSDLCNFVWILIFLVLVFDAQNCTKVMRQPSLPLLRRLCFQYVCFSVHGQDYANYYWWVFMKCSWKLKYRHKKCFLSVMMFHQSALSSCTLWFAQPWFFMEVCIPRVLLDFFMLSFWEVKPWSCFSFGRSPWRGSPQWGTSHEMSGCLIDVIILH